MNKKSIQYFGLATLTIGLGLLSRRPFIPDFIYPYLGDFMYALMFYFLMAGFFPNKKSISWAVYAYLICFSIELSQLIEADWFIQIQSTRIGRLVLGHGFLWSDLIAYLFGVLFGLFITKYLLKHLET